MSAWTRDTPWSQGCILPVEALEALGFSGEGVGGEAVVVVSHDCDVAQDEATEPGVELIVGRMIGAANGNFTFGKNARRLHLTFTERQPTTIELVAGRKHFVTKRDLARYAPHPDVRLTVAERVVLQRWLAARYRRAAFPDEFDRRLEETGLRDKLVKILKSDGALILAIYFDLDEGHEITRTEPDDPYSLTIYLLYDTNENPDAAFAAAQKAASSIESEFRKRCYSTEHGRWKNFELVACDPIADRAMTVQQAEHLKRWSADHLSMRPGEPQAVLQDQ